MGHSGHSKNLDYSFFYGKGNENQQLRTGFLYTTEENQHLREQSLIGIGRHI